MKYEKRKKSNEGEEKKTKILEMKVKRVGTRLLRNLEGMRWKARGQLTPHKGEILNY